MRTVFKGVAFPLSVLFLWYAVVLLTHAPPALLPPPHVVLGLLLRESGAFLQNTAATVEVALLGYAAANLLALGFALTFLYAGWLRGLATPWLVALQNLPIVSVASLLVITLGDTVLPRVLVVVIVCAHTLLANLLKGFGQIDPNLLARFQVLHASRWQLFRHGLWPNALPYYLAAHEVALPTSVIASVIAEFFFARQGLGYSLIRAMTEFRGDRLWATNLIIAGLSTAAHALCRGAEFYLLPWQRGRK